MTKKKQKVIQNFHYPVLTAEHRQYGASLLQAPILREDGDWTAFLPIEEAQQRMGIEPSDCYIEAQQHAIAMIHKAKFGETNNWSARFNALLSGGTPSGGDPVAGADSIRKDGLIAEELMTYDGLSSWSDFHSFKGADEAHCRAAGNADLYLYERNFGVVITRDLPVEMKYQILREVLKRSPIPFSLYALPDGKGSYVPKPKGVGDTHLATGVIVKITSDNRITIFDSYPPFTKELAPNYNMDFGMMWTVEKKATPEQKKSWFDGLVAFFKAFLPPQQSEEAINSIKPAFMDKKQELIDVVKSYIGKDASPENAVMKEVACAEGASAILHQVFPEFPKGIVSTADLFEKLKASPLFKTTMFPKKGCVIVSPRTRTENGHAGFFISDDEIVSNSSATGLMEQNYNWRKWVMTFKEKKGLHIYIFQLV